MTNNIDRVGRVVQPFSNHKIDFEPPRITGKPPIFGVNKRIEEQNRSIASRFVKIVRQIEELCKKQVFDQQFSEKLVSADFGKQLLHILIDKAVMRQRAAASLLGA